VIYHTYGDVPERCVLVSTLVGSYHWFVCLCAGTRIDPRRYASCGRVTVCYTSFAETYS